MARKKQLKAPDSGDTALIGRAGTVLVKTGDPEVDEHARKLWVEKNGKVPSTSFREFFCSLLSLITEIDSFDGGPYVIQVSTSILAQQTWLCDE